MSLIVVELGDCAGSGTFELTDLRQISGVDEKKTGNRSNEGGHQYDESDEQAAHHFGFGVSPRANPVAEIHGDRIQDSRRDRHYAGCAIAGHSAEKLASCLSVLGQWEAFLPPSPCDGERKHLRFAAEPCSRHSEFAG